MNGRVIFSNPPLAASEANATSSTTTRPLRSWARGSLRGEAKARSFIILMGKRANVTGSLDSAPPREPGSGRVETPAEAPHVNMITSRRVSAASRFRRTRPHSGRRAGSAHRGDSDVRVCDQPSGARDARDRPGHLLEPLPRRAVAKGTDERQRDPCQPGPRRLRLGLPGVLGRAARQLVPHRRRQLLFSGARRRRAQTDERAPADDPGNPRGGARVAQDLHWRSKLHEEPLREGGTGDRGEDPRGGGGAGAGDRGRERQPRRERGGGHPLSPARRPTFAIDPAARGPRRAGAPPRDRRPRRESGALSLTLFLAPAYAQIC